MTYTFPVFYISKNDIPNLLTALSIVLAINMTYYFPIRSIKNNKYTAQLVYIIISSMVTQIITLIFYSLFIMLKSNYFDFFISHTIVQTIFLSLTIFSLSSPLTIIYLESEIEKINKLIKEQKQEKLMLPNPINKNF
ncbi:hypothetical protein [Francisella sp. 19S2-10]|nr:hypothetical protein [Francisella sp. 19S2-10]MED7830889.1 hypothetical protein [Francisella sp. 19S2-10]